MDLLNAFAHLRDHGGDSYKPDKHFFMNHICAHSANDISRKASQSVASLVTHCSEGFMTAWHTGTSSPCTSLFKPIDVSNAQLPDYRTPGDFYDSASLWWRHEKLHRSILKDYPNRIKIIEKEQKEFEQSFINQFTASSKEDKSRMTTHAFTQGDVLTENWLNQIQDTPSLSNNNWLYRHYWKNKPIRTNILMIISLNHLEKMGTKYIIKLQIFISHLLKVIIEAKSKCTVSILKIFTRINIFSVLILLLSGGSNVPVIDGLVDASVIQFSGEKALTSLTQFVTQFPDRDSGQPNNEKAANWIQNKFHELGLTTMIDRWSIINYNRQVSLKNVIGIIPGESSKEIMCCSF